MTCHERQSVFFGGVIKGQNCRIKTEIVPEAVKESALRVQRPFLSLSLTLFYYIFFFLEQKRKKAERTFFQLWERLDGRGGFVWEQNVGWEVL